MYPSTTPAAVLTEYGQPITVHELSVPQLEPNAALVEVEAATMCGTDVHIQRGELSFVSKLPVLLGHEIVGRVVALGPERTLDALRRPLHEGDRVVWSYAWCGTCYWCVIARQPTLCEASRMYGWGPSSEAPYLTGGFAQYAYIMPKCQMLRVPDDLDAAVVASSTCAFRTVIHGYERLGRIEPHETVVVQGSGPVGLYAIAYAVRAGAGEVICIGAPDERLQVAARWGAELVLDVEKTTEEQRAELIRERTSGRGADVVVECSGASVALPEGLSLVRRGGRYLVLGQADPRPATVRGTDFNTKQLTVVGSLSGDMPHYYRALEFLSQHRDAFSFADIIGTRYDLSGVNDAIEAMANGREIKPVITV